MRTKWEMSEKVVEKTDESENDSDKKTSQSEEVPDSPPVSPVEGSTPANDKKNTSSGQNTNHSAREISPRTTKIPGSSLTSSSIHPNAAKTTIPIKVNTNSGKN